jgi:hypothetical protein
MNSRPSQQKKTHFFVINSTLFNELFQLIKTYFLVSLAPAFWTLWMSKIHNCNYFSQMFWTKMLSGCFSLWSPKFCYCYCHVVLPAVSPFKRHPLYIREKNRSHKTKNPLFHLVPCHEMLILVLNCLYISNIIKYFLNIKLEVKSLNYFHECRLLLSWNGLFQLPSPFHAQWTRPVKLFR